MSLRNALRLGLLLATGLVASVASAQPTFTKIFSPNTIGPGAVSMLTFTVNNSNSGSPVTDLAFIDNLPAAMTIATPANAVSTCTGSTLTAPDGGGTITLSDGSVGAGASCTIMVNVTSSTPGTHMNVSGDLTSSAGNSGTASADLTVSTALPGFSKSFAPSSIPLGNRSTLTFTIDNSLNPSRVGNLDFTDNLPTGMLVADPANASTNCISAGLPNTTITATPGTAVITLDANGVGVAGFEVLPIGATCTVSVDVVGTGAGVLNNISGEILADFVAGGKASNILEVTITPIGLTKSFTDDPVPPGGTVTLEFTINNIDRDFSATSIAFTDDLTDALSGLTATGLPLGNPCGSGSQLAGTSVLSLTGGNLPPEGSCTFSVTLQVPAGAAAGVYTNSTSAITGDVNGAGITGNVASEDLFVEPVPVLTKEFTDDPVGSGSTATLEFTITNTSATSTATAIQFEDSFPSILATAISIPPNDFCGTGSTATFTPLVNPPPPSDAIPARLLVSGANLAPSASCTFSITLNVAVDAPNGIYPNTTSSITATVDAETVTGDPATDDLVVVAAPTLSKEFTDDPVAPGGTATLEFTLAHDESAPGNATSVTFTDDLAAVLPGLAGTGLPLTDLCGSGNGTVTGTAGDTLLTFSDATLSPGEVCNFSVTLAVPAAAEAGSHTNTTSSVVATVLGESTVGNPGIDDLMIAGLTLTKEFTDDPVIPGGTVTLEFTIENTSPSDDATNIIFFDNLDSTLDNMTATGLPMNDICGAGSSLTEMSAGRLLIFAGGSLLVGESCTFSVTVQVPAVAASGTYQNATSAFSATVGGSTVPFENAADELAVSSDLLLLTKSFTDDPVAPGDTVTLEFTLTNLDASNAATGLAFTDDLDAALSGLAAVGLPIADVCGAGSQITGAGLLTLSGGNLVAGGSCTFAVTLQVPPDTTLGATATNTTSAVTGTIGGLAVTGDPATDELGIFVLSFSKTFSDPVEAGETVTLTFNIQNLDPTNPVTTLGFTDDLDATLSGLVATGLPMGGPCGAGSVLSGASSLTLTGGNLLAGGSCTFVVTLQTPGAAPPGNFLNVTSDLFGSGLPVAAPASDTLTITVNITNAATATADGATPVMGQTTDSVQP